MTALLPELRLARDLARSTGDDDLLVRLAAAMIWYGYHGQRDEVLGWGLDAATTGATHPRLPAALAAAGAYAWGRGDLDGARALGERAVAAAGGPGADAAYWALNVFGVGGLAMIRAWDAQAAGGARLGREAVRLAAESGNPTAIAAAGYALGEALGDHEPERAVALLERAAATARTAECRLFEGAASTAAVAIRSRHGDPAPVLADFRAVLTHWRRAGNDTLQVTALRNLLVLLARVGADEPAVLIAGALDGEQRLYRAEAERLARARAAVAERLGPERLAALHREGAALAPAELLDRVLEELIELSSN